jgi:hypothetical protein
MILIASAAFSVPELCSELGNIPPCLLPIGNTSLLELQVANLREHYNETIVVSLPANYILAKHERDLFERLNINLVQALDSLSLGSSLSYVLGVTDPEDDTLRVLHGDTLINDLPGGQDLVAIGKPFGDYRWEFFLDEENASNAQMAWSGFFCFSDRKLFEEALCDTSYDFVSAVKYYHKRHKLNFPICTDWYDFGHVSSYFFSRSKMTTERAFNTLLIDGLVVTKSSDIDSKINAERAWYQGVPPSIKKYCPQLLDYGVDSKDNAFYSLEYLPLLPLSEIYVYGRNSDRFWSNIFDLVRNLLAALRSGFIQENYQTVALSDEKVLLYASKTHSRLDEFLKTSSYSLTDTLLIKNGAEITLGDILDECILVALNEPMTPAILHGDLCFSNILFDSRAESLKLIDPRGLSARGEETIVGDQSYDVSKLCHSVIGMYDSIIAGHYTFFVDSDGIERIGFEISDRIISIQESFASKLFATPSNFFQVLPLTILLFLSMLPLHADRPDRQKAMLLNSARLYDMYRNRELSR